MLRASIQFPTLLLFLATLSSCGGGGGGGNAQGTVTPGELGSLTLEQYNAKLVKHSDKLNDYVPGNTYTKKYLGQVYILQNERPILGPQGPCVFDYEEEDTILKSFTKRNVDAQRVVYIHHRKILSLAAPHNKFADCLKYTTRQFNDKIVLDQVRYLTTGIFDADNKREVNKAVKNLTLRASADHIVTGEYDLSKRANAPKGIMFEEDLKRPFLYRFNFLNKIVNKPDSMQAITLPNGQSAKMQFIVKVDPAVTPQIVYKYVQSVSQKYNERAINGFIQGLSEYLIHEWSEPAGFANEKLDTLKKNDRGEKFKFGEHLNGFEATLTNGDVELTPDTPPSTLPPR